MGWAACCLFSSSAQGSRGPQKPRILQSHWHHRGKGLGRGASTAVPSTQQMPKWSQPRLDLERKQTRRQDSEPSERGVLQERLFQFSKTDWSDFTIHAQHCTETYSSRTPQLFTVWRQVSVWASVPPFLTNKRHEKSGSERAPFKDQPRFASRGLCNCLRLYSFTFLEMHFRIHFFLQRIGTSVQTRIIKGHVFLLWAFSTR